MQKKKRIKILLNNRNEYFSLCMEILASITSGLTESQFDTSKYKMQILIFFFAMKEVFWIKKKQNLLQNTSNCCRL